MKLSFVCLFYYLLHFVFPLLANESLCTYIKNIQTGKLSFRTGFIALQPKDQNVFTNQTLSAIESLVPKLWKTPYSLRVDALTNFQYTSADGDEIMGGDLVE